VSDGAKIWIDKGMGLVSTVFDDHRLAALRGHLAIGHTRYSTTGGSTWDNAQPVYRFVAGFQFALAHNGNLVNTRQLIDEQGECRRQANYRRRGLDHPSDDAPRDDADAASRRRR
jgi:amidophosphoribosyltransferase